MPATRCRVWGCRAVWLWRRPVVVLAQVGTHVGYLTIVCAEPDAVSVGWGGEWWLALAAITVSRSGRRGNTPCVRGRATCQSSGWVDDAWSWEGVGVSVIVWLKLIRRNGVIPRFGLGRMLSAPNSRRSSGRVTRGMRTTSNTR